MCGIAGIVGDRRIGGRPARAVVATMIAAMCHRGPDDSGVVEFPLPSDPLRVTVLGNARLAIQDPSPAGHQPMLLPTGDALVLNGEIYNHHALRRAIAVDGWASGSDTETVLRVLAADGPAGLTRLRGMFALAIRSGVDGSLLLARDRLGIKPLYVAEGPWGLLFASELRAILASGLVARRIDLGAVGAYARYGSVQSPRTLVDGVRELPPGTFLRISGGRVTQGTWWRLPEDSTAERAIPKIPLIDLLRDAVGEHLVSDVPVAVLLSGGLDSGLVTALAADERPGIDSFYVVTQPGSAESERARHVAAIAGTKHHEIDLGADMAADLLPRAVAAMDQPSIDGANMHVVSAAIRRAGISVALSGLGADEVFGGYPGFRLLPALDRLSALGLGPAAGWVLRRAASRGLRLADALRTGDRLGGLHAAWRSLAPDDLLREIGVAAPRDVSGERAGGRPRQSVSRHELSTYLVSTLLRDADAQSMRHSVELRVPFLDHRIVEWAIARRAAGPGRKVWLERVARRLPAARAAVGPKSGFVLPVARWLRGELAEWARTGIAALRSAGLVPADAPCVIEAAWKSGRLSCPAYAAYPVLGHFVAQHRLSIGDADAHTVAHSAEVCA